MSAEVFTPCDPDADSALQLRLPAEAPAVRKVLKTVSLRLAGAGFGSDACGTVEIVLAEVMNNIVEHACAAGGEITLRLDWGGAGVEVMVDDDGCAMPGGAFPDARATADAAQDLPEGGFGIAMIRALSEDLKYSRTRGRNRLSFGLLRKQAAASAATVAQA